MSAIVADFVRQRADDPALDPERFCRGYPEELRDQIVARCIGCLVFGPAALDHEQAVPRALGDFRILSELGRGGMAIVYLATQVSLGRLVALKVLAGQPSLEPASVARFHRESAAMARLRHPGIVQVHTVGVEDGTHFFAMDYVPGRSLRDYLDERRTAARAVSATVPELGLLPGRGAMVECVELAARVAEALDYAHRQGVVHRDVKPQNILVSTAGEVRLVDFGLAKDVSLDATLTQSGQIKGTPLYMSPEQVRGAPVDRRTDVFSLGVVLYELLTLVSPFAAKNVDAVLRAIETREPRSIRRLAPKVPRDLETICSKALEKDVHRRYASAGELAADLRRFLRLEPIRAVPAGLATRTWKWVRRHRRASVAGAAAAGLLVSLGAWQAVQAAEDRRVVGSELESAATAHGEGRFDDALEHARNAAQRLPGDREIQDRLARYRELWQREQQVRATMVEWAEAVRLITESQTLRDEDPCLALMLAIEAARRAPEKLGAAVVGSTLLGALARLREVRTLLGHSESVASAEFAPRGDLVVTAADDWTARIWDAGTGAQRWLLSGHHGPVLVAAFDSRGTAVITASADGAARLFEVGRSDALRVFRHERRVRCARFAPGDASVATGSDDGTIRIWDVGSGELRQRLEGHRGAVRSICFSPDGGRLVSGSEDRTFRVWELPGGATAFASPTQDGSVVCMSFDRAGRHALVCSGRSARVWDLERRECVRTCTVPKLPQNFVVSAAFSPDGRRVATASWDGVARIWGEQVDERLSEVLELRGHRREVQSIAFSPDGRQVITASRDGTARIWSADMDPTSRTPRQFGPDIGSAAFSPDGARLLLSTREAGRIQLRDTANGTLVAELALPDARLLPPAVFSPTGDRVLAPASDRTARVIRVADPRDVVVLGPHGGVVCSAVFDRSGKRVATAASDGTIRVWDAARAEVIASWPSGAACQARFLGDGDALIGVPGGYFHDPADDKWHPIEHDAVRVWNFDATKSSRTLFAGGVDLAVPSPDGTRLAVVRGGHAMLVDPGTGIQVAAIPLGSVPEAAFSAGSELLALCVYEPPVAIVADGRTGAPVATLAGHEQPLTFAAFTADSTRLVTASLDGTARVWHSRSGKAELVLRGHTGIVVQCLFSACGRYLCTVGGDEKALLWPARPLELAEGRLPRRLTIDDRRRGGMWGEADEAAERLVERLFAEQDVLEAVEAAIAADRTLTEPVRGAALAIARARGDRPWRLEQEAWAVVRNAASGTAALAAAQRRAAAADRLLPRCARFLRTLGAAHYRLGRYADAERRLAEAKSLDPEPTCLLFLAMSLHQLGSSDDARAILARLQGASIDAAGPEASELRDEAARVLAQAPQGRE